MFMILEVTSFEAESALVDSADLMKLKFDFLAEEEGFGIMFELTSANAGRVADLMVFWGKQLAPKSHKRTIRVKDQA